MDPMRINEMTCGDGKLLVCELLQLQDIILLIDTFDIFAYFTLAI